MPLYEIKDKLFYKDGTKITKKRVETELKKYQLAKLYLNNKYNVREPISQRRLMENKRNNGVSNVGNKPLKLTREQKRQKKQEQLLKKYRDNYKIEEHVYLKSGLKRELWRLNNKYGYWNFAAYLTDLEDETINNAILEDIRKQGLLKKVNK